MRPPCGTNSGYHAHHRRQEQPCEECRAAHAQMVRERHQRRVEERQWRPVDTWEVEHPLATGREVQPCGTQAAYRRHFRHRTPPCEPCRKAHAAYRRALYHSAREPVPRERAPCGTNAGYSRHVYHRDLPACVPCQEAHRAYNWERKMMARSGGKQ